MSTTNESQTENSEIAAKDKNEQELMNKATTSSANSAHAQTTAAGFDPSKMGILNDVTIQLSIEVGRANIKIKDLLNLTKDSIVDLNKAAGDPVDIYANNRLIAKGNIITANGKYCVRLQTIVEKEAK